MIKRNASSLVEDLAREFKIVAMVGPRQSGKTTLVRTVFEDRPYASLEDPDQLRFATDDPRRFLDNLGPAAVLDEVQRCPQLFSYIQGRVDEHRSPGQYILTGSQHFGLGEAIGQSLAGRVGFCRLLPLSLSELNAAGRLPESIDELLFTGGYPPIHDQPVTPLRWLNAYVMTYVERDLRQLVRVRDLGRFQLFLRLCAGSVGQLLNMSRLAMEIGVDQKTVGAWIDLLETSFVAFRLRPHFRNFKKRLVKTPKLYFHDCGLAARLLGIESPGQLATHPMRGALFENWAITEFHKRRDQRGLDGNLFFWRSSAGHEVDLIADHGATLLAVEIKSGSTVQPSWFEGLDRFVALAGAVAERPAVLCGGDHDQSQSNADVVGWRSVDELAARA